MSDIYEGSRVVIGARPRPDGDALGPLRGYRSRANAFRAARSAHAQAPR